MKTLQRKARLKAIKAAEKARKREARESGPEQPAPEETPQTTVNSVRHEWANEARKGVELTQRIVKEADTISNEEAKAMLCRAAKALDRIVNLGDQLLAEVDPAELKEAHEIVMEQRQPAEGNAQKRPRRAPNPVVRMIQIVMRAKSLLVRILKITNPELYVNLRKAS